MKLLIRPQQHELGLMGARALTVHIWSLAGVSTIKIARATGIKAAHRYLREFSYEDLCAGILLDMWPHGSLPVASEKWFTRTLGLHLRRGQADALAHQVRANEAKYGIDLFTLRKSRRGLKLHTKARQELMLRLRSCGLSMKEIAHITGRHHATVVYGIQQAKARLAARKVEAGSKNG